MPNLKSISFSSIPTFVSVVESGSFSIAAQQLGISKSAVSKRIGQLEKQLGVQLLHRSTRKISLSEAGKQYFQHARAALELANNAENAVTQAQPQGLLRINAPMTFGRLHIAPYLTEFLKNYPQIEIDLSMDDRLTDLVQGGFDLAIRIGQLADSSLIAKHLAPCNSWLCAAPEYLADKDTPQKPQDLLQHNCLFYSYFQAGQEWAFYHKDQPKTPIRVMPKGNLSINSSDAIKECLLSGLGICQMPEFLIADELQSGRLIKLMPDYQLPQHSIYAVYSQKEFLPVKVRVFIDFLQHKLRQVRSV